MPKRDHLLLIKDICSAIEAILEYTNGLDYATFTNDRKTIDAVIRNFEVIGEAAARVSDDFREANPLIEWREMKNFRNRLIHEYFGIDLETVWSVIQNEIPYNYELLKRITG